jgi:hypothetical protein
MDGESSARPGWPMPQKGGLYFYEWILIKMADPSGGVSNLCSPERMGNLS